MNLVVDGHIYTIERNGGISRVFDNLLPLLCNHHSELNVQILKKGKFVKQPSLHKQITIIDPYRWDHYFRPWRIWKKALPIIHDTFLKQLLGDTRNKIWLSTYYTPPPDWWKGKQIALVHDLIYEIFRDQMPVSSKVIDNKRNTIHNSDKVICISNTTASDLLRIYPIPKEKIRVAHLAYNEIFKPKGRNEIKHIIPYDFILFVGTRRFYKDFSTLLNAYMEWTSKEDIKLVVVGWPWTSEEISLLKMKSLDRNIFLYENCNDDALCDIYNQARAFIFPSRYEGFGIPVLEAMACGCPIIASRIPSTLEVAADVPMYFTPGDSNGLLDVLMNLKSKEELQVRVYEGIRKAKRFSWESTAKNFFDCIKN